MATKKKLKTRLDLIQEELDRQVYVVEDEDGKKVSNTSKSASGKNVYTKDAQFYLQNDIAPIRTVKSTSTSKKDDTWFSKGAFNDGYQFGDVTKTILGTGGDVVTGVAKGIFGLGEGVGDLINYGVAGVADAFGADDWADEHRKEVSKSLTNQVFAPAEEFYDKYSVIGEKGDQISQGLGNVAAIIATGGVAAGAGLGAVGTTAVTTGTVGLSSTGSGMSEAYQGGATDEEALKYGLISGAAEAGTELIFGGLGKGVKALGLSKGLSSADDMLAKSISDKFKSHLAKNLTQYTIKSGAEGLEEVLAGLIQAWGKKTTYMSKEDWDKIVADERLLDQFIMGAVTSGIAQSPGLVRTTAAGRDFISGYTQNEQSVIDKEVENRVSEAEKGGKKLTKKEISNITDEVQNDFNKGYVSTDTIESVLGGDTYSNLQSIRQQKTALEQEIEALENKPYAELTVKENERLKAIREQLGSLDTNTLETQLQSEMSQKIAKDSYLQQSYQEKAKKGQQFTYDAAKVTNENEKAVYESAAKVMNDTTRSHEFVEKVAKLAKDKGTNYGFINNAELKTLGHDVEGKQVNGLVRTSKDGKQTVLINIDSSKALNTIVGHETTHLLEGTQEYKDLQEAIFNYAKEKGDFDSRQQTLGSLYEGIENADVDAEITADLVGDYLFTDEKFIDSLSTQKPTVFQKIRELIDDLVTRFTGTKEEKALREVQKKFKEAYRKNAQSTKGTQYSLAENKIQGLENYSTDEIKQLSKEYIQQKLEESDLFDVNIKDIAIHGSRGRGTAKADSDLDVVVEYEGDIREDDLFSILNEDPMFIEDIQVDINPITESLSDYMERSNAYDKEVLAKQDTKYSLTDNQGRTLTKEQQEYFKDSKVRDENGNLLTMYHGTASRKGFNVFDIEHSGKNGSMYGTGFYFTSNRGLAQNYNNFGKGKIFETYLDVKNPLETGYGENRSLTKEQLTNVVNDLSDAEVNKYFEKRDSYYPLVETARKKLVDILDSTKSDQALLIDIRNLYSNNQEFIERFQKTTGYDGVKAGDGFYTVFNSNQIKNVDNTNPTSDADIRYSLTPDYGMSHRPSTDYGDASNFETNMPDVFEHPEWYMFGGDGWYKKAYNESWNALKKVRNNPDGEITIYRATIGDTFNEGDWVSPSKAYAEWHNYSNLEGKGKVIELKVKAKDIRFAGDDLNEFGYFPNGVDEYSLSRFNEQRAEAKGNYNVYGEDVKLEQTIAPLQEEIKTLTETVNELKEAIAPVKEEVTEVQYTQPSKAELDNLMALQEAGGTEYANTFFGLRDKYGQRKLYKGINEYKKAPDTYEAPIKGDEFAPASQDMVEQQNQEAFNNIDESNIPPEIEDFAPTNEVTETKSLFETRDYEEVGSRKINAYQYDNPEVKPFFQEEAQAMLGDLKGSIKGERLYNDNLYYETGGEEGYFGTQRQTTDDIAELLDGMDGKYKYSYADIEKGLNAIIEDKGSENNAVSKRIEFYLDKRLREGYTTVDGIEVPANQDYITTLEAKEITDYYNNIPIDESMIPSENVENIVEKPVENVSKRKLSENIAPIKVGKAQKVEKTTPKLDWIPKDPTKESSYEDIAEILTEEPKTASDRNKRKWAIFKANIFDKGIVFEDLALKENNRELIAKWDYTLTSEARGQYAIGNGHNGLSKSLNDIRAEVENTGNTKDFYSYMYHKHNVDRMTLASRFEGMENKPVFGESVTAEQSQIIVNRYEKAHPEFIEFAQDVYDYVNADKQLLVDNGVISQETADLWTKMYPHYVPTRRTTDTGLDINVPLDTNRTGINAPVKKATGGNSDILPLFDTMAMRTLQTYKATAKNRFGVELMNTMGTTIESNQTSVDEVIDNLDSQEGLLQEGEKGKNPTFTVFENGEKITFEITKDMYDALKPISESSLLSKTIKPLNFAGNLRRGVLTEYNPTFMLTNAIKDVQDVLLNSQHSAKTYAKIPEAYKQIATKGYWYQEYIRNGGEQNSYFDNDSHTFKTENKGLAKILDIPPLSTISKINNYIEMSPRLAEYIASRESGRSIEVSMLDAARVTTNFKAGGNLTKFANRNGATFLNASVQGAMQQIRNVREAKANGLKGWVNLATKFAIAGLPAILLNNLVWDDDEEYEELSDYVKQNYYVVAKDDNGNFIRIPKGRTVAVIQEAINQMGNLVTGDDEVDLKSFIDLTINNLAPNNPIDNNIISPIVQVANNEAWYGGDLVPTRLQNLPAAEQYDESTDMFSRWVGETFNVSPYKVNYLIDQYSGGVGDVLLPIMTPEAKNDADSFGDYLFAPLKSKFTTNSTLNNQNVSDFYDISEKLTIEANKSGATDEDVLSNKYINAIKSEMNKLYTEKREIQNSDMPNSKKYSQVLEIQSQINELAKQALSEYTNIETGSNYSTVGDKEYYKRVNNEGEVEWTKVDENEAEDLNNIGLTSTEKNTYFSIKSDISSIIKEYKDDKSNLDEDSEEYKEALDSLSDDKKIDIIDKIMASGLNNEQKAYLYGKYYSSEDTLEKVTNSGIEFDDFLTYHKDCLSFEESEEKAEYLYNADMSDEAKTVIYETSVLTGFDNEDKNKGYKAAKAAGININAWLSYKKQEFVADKNKDGDSISGSRKRKVIQYVNELDLSIPEKAILIKATNTFKFNEYNNQIIKYVDGLDISYEEKVFILEELDMVVDSNGNITWE